MDAAAGLEFPYRACNLARCRRRGLIARCLRANVPIAAVTFNKCNSVNNNQPEHTTMHQQHKGSKHFAFSPQSLALSDFSCFLDEEQQRQHQKLTRSSNNAPRASREQDTCCFTTVCVYGNPTTLSDLSCPQTSSSNVNQQELISSRNRASTTSKEHHFLFHHSLRPRQSSACLFTTVFAHTDLPAVISSLSYFG